MPKTPCHFVWEMIHLDDGDTVKLEFILKSDNCAQWLHVPHDFNVELSSALGELFEDKEQ